MKVFIKKFDDEILYGFTDEAERNEGLPREGEQMAGVSARKVAEWRKVFDQFVEIQKILMELYEGKTNQPPR